MTSVGTLRKSIGGGASQFLQRSTSLDGGPWPRTSAGPVVLGPDHLKLHHAAFHLQMDQTRQ